MNADDVPRTLGPYEVLTRLSRGGMGEVFLGRRLGAHGFERLVALKTIRADLTGDSNIKAMFLDEARLAARITHPAVAQVFDFGEEAGRLWLAMEYVAGVALSRIRSDPPELPPLVVAQIIAEAARGLHAAHETKDPSGRLLKVVHRDISPDNLVLSFDGHVKVLDFGIALVRDREQPVTEVGQLKGKMPYMAPEQICGDPVDRRTDVYALGLVLNEMLSGKRTFEENEVLVSLAKKPRKIPLPSASVGPMPAGLEAVMLKALADDPVARWATALEFSEALAAVAASVGTPSLDRYCAEALADAAMAQRQWLSNVLATAAGTPGSARPVTPARVPPGFESQADTRPQAPRAIATARGSRRTQLGLAALFIVALGVVLVVLRSRELSAVPEVSVPAEVSVPDVADANVELVAALVEPASPPDAGQRVAARPTGKPRSKDPRVIALDPIMTTIAADPVVGEGKLTVGAEPFVLVRLDGKDLGPTPIILHVLSAGPHRIELVSPDTQAVRLDKRFNVAPGEQVRIQAP